MKLEPATNRVFEDWVRANIGKLAADENGRPIDPAFTGAIEIMQPNGLVGEYLEVKKGKPNGAYRTFYDDGTVKKVVFYKSGKVSGDFWPDGTIKHKKSTRGGNTVLEWFYPSGRLQKVMVVEKSGYLAEPARLFHENGQLAEELTKEKDKRGPWFRYFDDGSPQLQADHDKNGQIIVHNAWDGDRNQVVKDGTGVFFNDARSIDWQYEVFFEHDWKDEREVKNGIPHGKMTRYNSGELWSVEHYENGVRHGDSILYWDNGRVHAVTKYVNGKEGKSKHFPKYDQPVPAVLIRVEASEKLYTAWNHPRVDEYPTVLNLNEVERQVKIPDFLREVDERNRAGSLKSDYEDWNKFDDGIAYFLMVDEKGKVTSATANGSGVYSGGLWDTYVPLLKKLRFSPGKKGGRAIECRVLARVDHTFVEGKVE
jgi:antitoxin component YwqK of YwqJK toxin-antitoxin module